MLFLNSISISVGCGTNTSTSSVGGGGSSSSSIADIPHWNIAILIEIYHLRDP